MKKKIAFWKNCVLERIQEGDLVVWDEFFITIQRTMKNSVIKECEEWQMEHVSLDVKGMSCEHCVKAVETNVGVLNGVDRVEVHLKEGKVEVEFNSEQVSIETVKSTIEDQGYDVAKWSNLGSVFHFIQSLLGAIPYTV